MPGHLHERIRVLEPTTLPSVRLLPWSSVIHSVDPRSVRNLPDFCPCHSTSFAVWLPIFSSSASRLCAGASRVFCRSFPRRLHFAPSTALLLPPSASGRHMTSWTLLRLACVPSPLASLSCVSLCPPSLLPSDPLGTFSFSPPILPSSSRPVRRFHNPHWTSPGI